MIEQFVAEFETWAQSFGAKPDGVNCFLRSNTKEETLSNGGAYFGYVQPEEGSSGQYHDFSLVVFPDLNGESWLVSLCVGSLGFRNDYDLASRPGIRRRFQRLITKNGFVKADFLDIENELPKDFYEKAPHIERAIEKYRKVISACELIDPHSDIGKTKVKGFLALYADVRNWGKHKYLEKEINKCIKQAETPQQPNQDKKNVSALLDERKYLVLQGPPGTGKTRLAKLIANEMQAKVFFTQFHAETSNADFVWGIRPKLKSEQLGYEPRKGELVKAIGWAIDNPNSKVVLIIDEINRANLSNVLGPVFYLFEYQMEPSDIKIIIAENLELDKLPDNFYVMATMNTADRSLAVVDFALRRRFAWYTLWPKAIDSPNFYKDYFDKISGIFEKFASDEELNLQPGQGYFLANSDSEMRNRLKYEVMPLIKEYLVEGLLTQSKDAFSDFFYQSIQEVMYR
ncbi:MAG: AAA family ATPase [Eubacteriales bacterium]|nr:AAA family ATPase [Eubacteriales bacterium]